MIDTLREKIQRLFQKAKEQPPVHEPADFIIERYYSVKNGCNVYRIRQWLAADKRYSFEGEDFWIGNTWNRLRYQFHVDPEEVPIVDIYNGSNT
jgi:hypothetical protein